MKYNLAAVVEFAAIFLMTLVIGVFWGTWFTLTRSIENFSPSEFIHIGQTIIGNVAVPMRIIMPRGLSKLRAQFSIERLPTPLRSLPEWRRKE